MYVITGFALENCDGRHMTGSVWTLQAVSQRWRMTCITHTTIVSLQLDSPSCTASPLSVPETYQHAVNVTCVTIWREARDWLCSGCEVVLLQLAVLFTEGNKAPPDRSHYYALCCLA